MRSKRTSPKRDILALLNAAVLYWLTIYPRARRELGRWRLQAQAIPDLTLREQALMKLTAERLNPEAAAFFAILAPRRHRPRLVRLMVAYQLMYDYLDAINEQHGATRLENGFQLHRALTHAIAIADAPIDYYRHHPQRHDGGYLQTLIDTCATELRSLPSTGAIMPRLLLAARRCGEAQSRNHAVLSDGTLQLRAWSVAQAPDSGYLWWELSAAGISCLSIHALFAAAACITTLQEAERIDQAYFPSICAISALLDSLIDLPRDRGTTNHSFADHYPSSEHAADRFERIAREAHTLTGELRHHRRHRIILNGIASFYLSAPEAWASFAAPVTRRVTHSLGSLTTPILAVMRLRRNIHRKG